MMTESSQLPVLVSPPAARPFWRQPRFWLALLALALVGWHWLETQTQLELARQELARSVAESDKRTQEAEKRFTEAVLETAELARSYRTLAARQEEFQGQADALHQIYQEASLNREDALMAEIERNLGLAAQQLQIFGNSQAAILLLDNIDSRLAKVDSPLFLPMRRALARELEQLRATPFVDVPGISLRLENITLGIDRLPLAVAISANDSTSPEPPVNDAPAISWWRHLAREGWQEVKNLVRVQRFDRKEPILLRSDQALVLRENVKLRLLNARLALFSRDQWTFRNELSVARQYLLLYFNAQEKPVKATLEALRQLSATELTVELPALSDSLVALKALKENREKH